MNRIFAAVLTAGFVSLAPMVIGADAASAQTSTGVTCRVITAAALQSAANASGLSAAILAMVIEHPACGRQVVRAVNTILSQAPAEQRQALANQAAAGFVSAQQALIDSGNVGAATTLAGVVASSGSSALQTAFAAASAANPVTAGGSSGTRPGAQAFNATSNNASSNAAVVLAPGSLGGSGGSGGSVSPVRP